MSFCLACWHSTCWLRCGPGYANVVAGASCDPSKRTVGKSRREIRGQVELAPFLICDEFGSHWMLAKWYAERLSYHPAMQLQLPRDMVSP